MLPRDALDDRVARIVETAAAFVLAAGLLTVAAAVAAALLSRRGLAPRFTTALARLAPWRLQKLAALCVATVATVATTSGPAGADSSVRDWLAHGDAVIPSATTTTTDPTTAPGVATQDELERRSAPLPDPTSPPPAPASPPDARATDASPPRPARDATASSVVRSPPARATAIYVVQPGDCLWSIAAQALGRQATNAAIDLAWRRIYAVNRAAVGDDPGLIHPGLALTLPSLDPTP
jgi:resuscitation-promoting factor RpfA